ncbi:MAG: hypothetical protein Kow0080_00010 [Candidatus Promineifilaceae bacterium]
MTKLQALIRVIILSSMLWGVGFLGQKLLSTDYKINTGKWWVIFLGIRPGSQPVYIRSAIVQIVALLTILVGSIIIWLSKIIHFALSNALTIMVIELTISSIVIGVVDIWNNYKSK